MRKIENKLKFRKEARGRYQNISEKEKTNGKKRSKKDIKCS